MALEAALRNLQATLKRLHKEDLAHLHWSVVHGRTPPASAGQRSSTRGPARPLPRDYRDLMRDLLSRAKEAREAADGCLAAFVEGKAIPQLMNFLDVCCAKVETIVQAMSAEFSEERLRQLEAFAREKQRGWPEWAAGIRQAVPPCRAALQEVNTAVLRCLRELAERGGSNSVLVNNNCNGPTVNLRTAGLIET